jgi:hypothetical protein
MRVHHPLVGAICLLLLGLAVLARWIGWGSNPPPLAWVVDSPEQIISGAETGKPVQVPFRLRNTSSQPLRVLGTLAC